jgi:hypothetical protein
LQEFFPLSIDSITPAWSRLVLILALGLGLSACTTTGEKSAARGATWGGRPIGTPPAPNPGLKRAIVKRALGEWEYFGRQTVVFRGSEESIPHVGSWEDDNASYSDRVGMYWRAAGKAGLNGMDCREPWSAAFISYVLQGAGVPGYQFHPATAHSVYLANLINESYFPGRWFVPRRVRDYSPNPGDLICAPRGASRPASFDGYLTPQSLQGANTHCDLVVAKSGQTLESVGGNVRNSVSRTTLELDGQGHLQPVARRPWFLIMENRL